MVKLSSIKLNPDNPRIIKDHKFKQLVKSIQEFPAMLKLRPLVVDAQGTVLGGNMRLKALQELKQEIPNEWIKKASDLTEEEVKRFIVVDNIGFGEHDWEALANGWDVEELKECWDVEELKEWGLDIPEWAIMPEGDELIGDDKNKPATMKITFPTPDDLQKCESDIQEVLTRLCPKSFYSVSAGEI